VVGAGRLELGRWGEGAIDRDILEVGLLGSRLLTDDSVPGVVELYPVPVWRSRRADPGSGGMSGKPESNPRSALRALA
jgi:hypothetical protein